MLTEAQAHAVIEVDGGVNTQTAVPLVQAGAEILVAGSALFGAAMPATASALGYYDSIRRADSPSNLIQAQRDYFGAHTFERKDRLHGEFFHNNWTH